LLATYAMDDDYAKYNDFYHDVVDADRYPKDGFDARLAKLKYDDVSGGEAVKKLVVKYNLTQKISSELDRINNPNSRIPDDRKKSINEILGYRHNG
jgi:hypothetical protein